MESNNHFNYGSHSSANSGLKRSSGDSLYTNGSSMSFSQQGKNMNGEINVNGTTTVLGSGVPSSHPPTAPYPHMSNHHQSSMSYDYLWGGGHPQYSPAMGTSPGHGMHQKQPAAGMAQPQSQHHFQGHGQYQLNGGIEGSHQPAVAGPTNMPLTGSQYWNRSNPGPQQMGYNSHGVYGTYQSQAHPGITPSQHHQQQQQQSLQSPPHQASQQQLHSHRHPQQQHHHQQHQQPQHYGLMPNGMPYYQHQPQHQNLPSPQQQQSPQPPAPAQLMPPATQNFTPPRGSPQHHGVGRAGTGSPLLGGMTSATMISPSTVQDSGSPNSHGRDSSLGVSGVSRDAAKEGDTSYNGGGGDRAPVVQRFPKSDSYQTKPSAAHVGPAGDYRRSSDQLAAQCQPDMSSAAGDAAVNPPLQFVSSASSSAAPPKSVPVSSPDMESAPPRISASPGACPAAAAPPQLSSPPRMVQCPRSFHSEGTPAGSLSSSSLSASPQKLSTPSTVESVSVSLPDVTSSSPAPLSSLQQMVKGSIASLFPDASGARCERPGPPRLVASSSSAGLVPSAVSKSGAPISAPPGSCSSTSTPCDHTHTPPAVDAGLSTASAAAASSPGEANLSSLAAQGPKVQHLSTLPLLTTQASRTAALSAPPASVSSPPASGSSSGSDSEQHPSNTPPPLALEQPSPRPQHHGHRGEDGKVFSSRINVNPEERGVPQPDSSSRIRQAETSKSLADLPPPPATASDQMFKNQQKDSEKRTPPAPSSPRGSTRVQRLTRDSFNDSSSQLDGDSWCDTPSRMEVSSAFEKSSLLDDGRSGSDNDDEANFDKDASGFDSSSQAEEEELTACDATGDGSFFSADESRDDDDTLDDTLDATGGGGETSEAEETESSFQVTGGSALESSLNSTAPLDEPPVDSSDGPNSRLLLQIGRQGAEAEWEARGRSTPDSAGSIGIKTTVDESVTLPSLNVRDENFIAFSTPVQSPAVHPLQPVTDPPASTAATVPLTVTGKQRKPRTPKAMWIKKPVPVSQRKPRSRTPKVEPVKPDDAEGSKPQAAAGRKRKKSLRADAKEPSATSVEAGPPAEQLDTVTATIEAVLAEALASVGDKPTKAKRARKPGAAKTAKQDAADATAADDNAENDDDSSTAGESKGRRVATEEQVQFPLAHGWKREIRVKKAENRMKGETWYYTPCGRRMKQFPEIVKYLKRHTDTVVSREHFSFSPRMPVGDFYEERDTPEGLKWMLLANEEVPSMIMAITGRRGRPPNPDKEKPRRARGLKRGPARRPGRPPKPKMIDLLSKVDARLLTRLEAKDTLTDEDKEKMAKIKKKMKKKARMKRRQDTKMKKMKEEKKKAKLEEEDSAEVEPADPKTPTAPQPVSESPAAEPKKPGRRRSAKVVAPPPVRQTDEERIAQGKRVLSARSKAKALAKAQAEADAAAQAALSAKRAAERRAQAQRRLEERKRQQLIAEELKKPAEDMCLTDHKLLPELSRIPGVVLSGTAFAHCLAVVEFLHGYGKLIGLNIPKDVPSLATLQEGLLGLGEGQGEVQDLLIKLVEAALHDPGLPSYYQSVKILGDKLVEWKLTRSTVSEVLRVFLESHGFETDVCDTLRTKTFHALPPDTKASILGFLVDVLNGSNVVTSDIDNTLENIATYRKNKWIIEGKLRKLKAALSRRTGRSEEELCFEERRRSARVAEEENLSLEEVGTATERGNRRARKEEPKLSDSESPTTASVPELERQIDKLTKRQAFFRKKLLLSSNSMRAILLGQDRYRRRYLALPHLGGILVEGPEELLTSGDVLVAEVPVTFLKKEPKVEEIPVPTTSPAALPSSPSSAAPTAAQSQSSSPEEDPLPGTASLMSRPRGRGRPRKIKPEVELHLRTAKIRRRRRSSVRSGGEEGPGSPNSGTMDLTQTAFHNWLSQSQEAAALSNGTSPTAGDAPEGNRPEETVKQMAEKQGQWFNLLPKQPCDHKSLTEPQAPASPRSPPKLLPQVPGAPLLQPDPLLPSLAPADPSTPATPQDLPPALPVGAPPPLLPDAAPPAQTTPTTPTTPKARPIRRRRRGSRGGSPARRGPRGAAAKRRGRPPSAVFQELEQQYFTQLVVKPIPSSMVRGWWWIKDPEELYCTLQALHPRGIREKVLHKHLAKHMESLTEMCSKSVNDPMFESKLEQKDELLEALQQPWQVQERAMETDLSALQWVEDLEQRVIAADLHLKAPPQSAVSDAETNTETPAAEFQPYTIPDPDTTRDDLQYYEHEADPRDDWTIRTKKEWSGLPRIATHPLDLAVLRLSNLERNIERRYLKEPLWNPAEVMRLAPLTPTPGEEQPMDAISLESEITSRLRTWRQALDRCRSAPQVCLCLLQLEKAIAWERSVTKVNCQVCRKGDNDDCLLLCDGCDRGCHMYCLRPKITQVPEGDWFCPTCVARDEGESPRLSKSRVRTKKRRYEDDSSEDETSARRSSGMATRNKETAAPSSSSRHSGEGGAAAAAATAAAAAAAKRRRMTTRNQPDLTFCEIILMEMESHADAWPFLEPVNPRLVPGYRRIIKNPMDFLTMRERLLQGGYCSCEEFAADAHLVFNNCEMFNEDTSEVGAAGHAMRRFFESRWAEFYSNRDK